MSEKIQIGIVAPSSRVPQIELKLGVDKIKREGFAVKVHPQCKKGYLFFAGTDEERASAFLEYAYSLDVQVIWCARGGSGALRLLSVLDQAVRERGLPPKKLLIGFSDVTALMHYVQTYWGWSTLHAPMPTMRKFSLLPEKDWLSLTQWIRGLEAATPWKNKKLQFWTPPLTTAVEAPLVGGNLTVWNTLLATPYEAHPEGCFLFFEDIDEGLYRIDRMLQQLLLSGGFKNVRGLILGNFLNCRDGAPSVLKKAPTSRTLTRVLTQPRPQDLKPLRKVMKESQVLREMFLRIGNLLKVPVVGGLPAGHGPEVSPLPLGATYQLTPEGHFNMISWDWLRR